MYCEICNNVFISKRNKRTCSKKCEYILKGKKTSEQLKISFNEEQYKQLKEVLTWGYVKDIQLIIQR